VFETVVHLVQTLFQVHLIRHLLLFQTLGVLRIMHFLSYHLMLKSRSLPFLLGKLVVTVIALMMILQMMTGKLQQD
jgi:hypothetical protein